MNINRSVENVYIRQEAVHLTRRHFWRLLGMCTIVFFCTAILTDILFHISGTFLISDPLIASLFSALVSVMGLCISAPVLLGYRHQLLTLGRGSRSQVWGVFGRLRYWLKASALTLLMHLKIALWSTPGVLLHLLAEELPLYGLGKLSEWVNLLGFAVILWLALPASLSYAMALFILADEPDRGVSECIEHSKGLMTGRRWQAFRLVLPPVLIVMGILCAVFWLSVGFLSLAAVNTTTAVFDIFCVVILLLISLSSVYFILQLDMVCAIFYLHTRRPVTLEGTPKPVSYWLRDHTETAKDMSPGKAEES